MPAFTYTGETDLYYPSLGVHATPGLVAELDAAPDARWEPTPGAVPTVHETLPLEGM
ncbi:MULTISPECIES: hypothetical protein [unclassified Kitasatospora]|uniref:hypothetical protein n=1 Tax=unclassified Kitasatospora TaxID=2633591 RepID=UPI002476EEB3|nr:MULTISPECIES: hypothetical protein [unclassified Kitasatospora]MDH6123862.1 hypothetical protein [Kitasatospora sp. GP82]MDH6576039.1 hypothetical protein [Kitasatospora sp. MAP5-34]